MARPRDPGIETKILNAARTILARDGYDGLNLTAVAEEAGVGKPALYRRYSSRAELVFALTVEASLAAGLPDRGSFAGDIRAAVTELVRTIKQSPRQILGEQIGHAMADPAFGRKMRRAHIDPTMDMMLELWRRGLARGEVDAAVNGPRALRDLSSTVIMQVMLFDDEDELVFVDELMKRFLKAVGPRQNHRHR